MRQIYRINYLVIAVLFMLLSGCSGTQVRSSNVLDKTARQVNELRVLYIENKLTVNQSNPARAIGSPLDGLGYEDLSYVLRERIPSVFALNGLKVEVETVKREELNKQDALLIKEWAQNSKTDTPVLMLEMVGGSSLSSTMYGSSNTSLVLQASLVNPKGMTKQWSGSFENIVGSSPFRKQEFNFQFVDGMLKKIIEQMSKDNVISIPNGEVALPNSSNNCEADQSKRILDNRELRAEKLARVAPTAGLPDGGMQIIYVDGKSTYRCDKGNLGSVLVKSGQHSFVVDIFISNIIAKKNDEWQQWIWKKWKPPMDAKVFNTGINQSIAHSPEIADYLLTHKNAIEIVAEVEQGEIYVIQYGMEPGENNAKLHRAWISQSGRRFTGF